jgi:4'-phosphopantetheinyl transferase
MILSPPSWSKGPLHPTLLPGEIHLWRASLACRDALRACYEALSSEERCRAAKFVFEADAFQYIISHGALRMVLARYTGIHAADLEFTTSSNGKPRLIQTFTDYRFNLSHTEGLALIAVARGHEVGVDVERINHTISFEEIAAHYFEPREVWDLRIAPAPEKAARFYELWTRKEAELKATGSGLARLGLSHDSAGIIVRNLSPAEGYAGAIAGVGDDWRLACWEWSL